MSDAPAVKLTKAHLVDALEPLARLAGLCDRVPKLDIKDTYLVKVPLGDLRRARALLDALKEEGEAK